jgi:hypothetical protein
MRDNADRKVEVPYHSPDDGQLLKIFFSEDGEIRSQNIKKLRYHRTDSSKMAGSRGAAHQVGQVRFDDFGRVVRKIHLFRFGSEDQIALSAVQQPAVRAKSSRILMKIFLGPKLHLVNEEAGGGGSVAAGDIPGLFHQGKVSSVKRAHGRNQDQRTGQSSGKPLHKRNRGYNAHERDCPGHNGETAGPVSAGNRGRWSGFLRSDLIQQLRDPPQRNSDPLGAIVKLISKLVECLEDQKTPKKQSKI